MAAAEPDCTQGFSEVDRMLSFCEEENDERSWQNRCHYLLGFSRPCFAPALLGLDLVSRSVTLH
jgi:hypothetical protein